MHALVIEDHALVAALFRECLSDIGYDTFDFAVGKPQAVAAARAKRPDLIVADDRLAAGTGLGAVTEI